MHALRAYIGLQICNSAPKIHQITQDIPIKDEEVKKFEDIRSTIIDHFKNIFQQFYKLKQSMIKNFGICTVICTVVDIVLFLLNAGFIYLEYYESMNSARIIIIMTLLLVDVFIPIQVLSYGNTLPFDLFKLDINSTVLKGFFTGEPVQAQQN